MSRACLTGVHGETPNGAARLAVLALLAALAPLLGCPSHPIRPTDGVGPAAGARCWEASDLLKAGAYDLALEALEGRLDEDPSLAGTTRAELCMARALLGAGRAEEARDRADPLLSRSALEADQRRAACWYSAWASLAAGDEAEGETRLQSCGPPPLPDQLFGAEDATVMALLAFRRAVLTEPPEAALREGGALLGQDDPLDETSHRWVVEQMLSLSDELTPENVQQLSFDADDAVRAVAFYAAVRLAVEEARWSEAEGLAPEARQRLQALGAPQAIGELDALLATRDDSRPPVFGCVLSLGGANRPVGRAALAGLLLAQLAFEPDLEARSQLIVRDAGETAESARAAVDALDALGVLAIVGPVQNDLARAVAAEADRLGLPVITLASDASSIRASRWSFRLFADPELEALVLADFALDEGLRRVAIAQPVPTPEYLTRLIEAFSDAAMARGVVVTEPVRYLVDDLQAEAAAAAETLAGRDFEALLIADSGARANTLGAYLGVHDIWARGPGESPTGSRRRVLILGNSFWHNPEFLLSGPDYLAGGVFPAWLPAELGFEGTERFVERFQEVYGRRPSFLEAFAHDALALLHYLVLDVQVSSRAGLRDAIEQLEGVEGATGELRFAGDHAGQQRPFLLKVTSGGFAPL